MKLMLDLQNDCCRAILRLRRKQGGAEHQLSSVEEQFAQALTQKNFTQIRAIFDAALLVFSHSILDGVAMDLCRATALYAPKDWESSVEKRKVLLSDSKVKTYDELLNGQIEEYLLDLEHKSLLTKINTLFARCRPAAEWLSAQDYKYEPDKIEELDNLRHEIVHGDALGRTLTGAKDGFGFLLSTSVFLTQLAAYRYEFEFDREKLFSFVPYIPRAH